MEKEDQEVQVEPAKTEQKPKLNKYLKGGLLVALALVLVAVSIGGYLYAASPAVIRSPKLEHYHFRMQIIVDGKSENFAADDYQKDYAKDQCSTDLPEQPIHFHDKKDQFVHIHWAGMTGGLVMKQYGWNYIGGLSNSLGYTRHDGKMHEVKTHGSLLPAVPADAQFYVYAGDETAYQEKSFEDWKTQDLEQFFGKQSNFPGATSFWDTLFPKASAHGAIEDGHKVTNDTERLEKLNNLIGNVVIFVQKDKPTDQQIKDRFNDLEPLSESTCAG
jgi:hypothetical protein